MKYYGSDIDNLQKLLDTDFACGLSEKEAKKRLSHYGKNIIFEHKKIDSSKVTLKLLYDPVTFLLLICAVICATTSLVSQAILIFSVLFINLLITILAYHKSENVLYSMKSYGIPQMKVLRDKKTLLIDSRLLVPGDVVLLEKGDIICADCKLMSSDNLLVYEKDATGNEEPQIKFANDKMNSGYNDILFASSSVIEGHGVAVVTACGANTEIVFRSGLIPLSGKHYPELFHTVKKRCRTWGLITSFISIMLFTVNLFTQTYDIFDAFLLSISLMAATMTETMLPLTHISASKEISLAAMTGNKSRAIIKNPGCIEKLRSISVFVLTDEITNFENMNFINSLVEKRSKAIICACSKDAFEIATRYGASVCKSFSEIEYAKGSLAVFVSDRVDDSISLVGYLKEKKETVGVLTTKLEYIRLLACADVSFTYGKFKYKTGEISKILIDNVHGPNNQILSRISDVICEQNMASTYRAVDCSKKIYSVISHSATFLITLQLVRTALCLFTLFSPFEFITFTQILVGGLLFDLFGVLFLSLIESNAFPPKKTNNKSFSEAIPYSFAAVLPCIFYSLLTTVFWGNTSLVTTVSFLSILTFLPIFVIHTTRRRQKNSTVISSVGYLITLTAFISITYLIPGMQALLNLFVNPASILFVSLSAVTMYLLLYVMKLFNSKKIGKT